jgi:AAHS family benzoate transporter-like MFS transporter
MRFDVNDNFINKTRIISLHVMIVFWYSMLMIFDGYDLVIYGA